MLIEMNALKFELKNAPSFCEVFSGANLTPEIVKYLLEKKASKYAIITDSKVKTLHGERLLGELKKAGIDAFLISFPEGEKNKTRETKAFLEDELLKQKCGRDTIVIALGGGVVGDVAGFVAGTYMRGVPCVQIPTTTIAIGDSSYGGKTALDVPAGKNLIGVYHQPVAVFMDSVFLKTLDERNYVSGLVEIIKHGLIKDKKLYDFLKKNLKTITSRNGKDYEKIMETVFEENIKIKRDVVVADPTEKNLRKILNYGHTIGHAVEKLSNYKLLHGEAIAIGISAEAFLASRQGILSKEDFLEQKNLFESMGISTKIPAEIKTADILQLMKIDKKARNATPEFSLISKIGKYAEFEGGKVAKSFGAEDLENAIEEYRKLK